MRLEPFPLKQYHFNDQKMGLFNHLERNSVPAKRNTFQVVTPNAKNLTREKSEAHCVSI